MQTEPAVSPLEPRPDREREHERRAYAIEQELKTFSYIVSHDLSASVRHVSEFSRLLLGEMGENLTPRQMAHAERIRISTHLCQAMMEQLLVYSRAQQKVLNPVSQDGLTAVRKPMLVLAQRAREAQAEFSLEPLGPVFADPDLLDLMLTHLLDNAIKFHRTGVPPRIAVTAAHDDAYCRIQVSDNGLGLESAYHEKAFQMFARLHTDQDLPGVGAGLAICRRVARRHGGDVRFIDSYAGARVELALPWPGDPDADHDQ